MNENIKMKVMIFCGELRGAWGEKRGSQNIEVLKKIRHS